MALIHHREERLRERSLPWTPLEQEKREIATGGETMTLAIDPGGYTVGAERLTMAHSEASFFCHHEGGQGRPR